MMDRRKVFVSFDYENDRQYKTRLEAWDANPRFEFIFADGTSREIDKNNIDRIKAELTARINEATHTLVIIGQYADTPHPKRVLIGYRNWLNFEIAKSRTCCNKVAAVKIDPSYESPEELITTAWAFDFDEDSIVKALDQAC
jgi:Thoeris protein ThsB, TIR-like domain